MNDLEFLQQVHKYRDEPGRESAIPFHPSIANLMDAPYCKSIDRLLHENGRRWERRNATPTLGASLPTGSGIYMFVWRPELTLQFAASPALERFCWVLYVGKAGIDGGEYDTLRDRYLSSYAKYVDSDVASLWERDGTGSREQRLARYLSVRPLEYWFLLIEEKRDIPILERKLIRFLGPPGNQQHGPKVKPGKTVPAFEENPHEQ